MSPSVVTVRRDDLFARRRRILERLGMSLDEFKNLAATSVLTGDQWDALEDLDNIAFLLGEGDVPDAE
jgi:hypothetical protein